MIKWCISLLFAFLCLCPGLSRSQPRLEWSHNYVGEEYRSVLSHIVLPDGRFALACETGDNRQNLYDFLLILTNEDGEIEWECRHGERDVSESPYEVIQNENGDFLIVGNAGLNLPDIHAVAISAEGEVIWSNNYGRNGHDEGFGVVPGIDGGYIIAGKSHSFGNESDGYVIAIDDEGELQWERNYDFGGRFDMFMGIIRNEQDYMLYGEGGENRLPLIALIDADGELVWSRRYDVGGGLVVKPWDGIKLNDGGYALACHINLAPGSEGFVIRTDGDGEILWTGRYEGGEMNTKGSSIAELRDGSFVVGGQTENQFGWIKWLDSEGNEIGEEIGRGTNIVSIKTANGNEAILAGRNGNSGILMKYSLNLGQPQLYLHPNWDIYSTHITPAQPDIPTLFAPLVERESLILVKNQAGRFYSPQHDFNNMDDWDVHSGYLIKMERADSLEIIGEPVADNEPIPLQQGWNMIAYFPQDDRPARQAFAPILDNLIIAKDGAGQFYLPEQDFNNIPSLHRGAGYLIKVTEDCELIWGEQ